MHRYAFYSIYHLIISEALWQRFQANDAKYGMQATDKSGARGEKPNATKPIIFFLAIIIFALVACAVFQRTEYLQIKRHDVTNSADDLNGQSPANTVAPASTIVPASPPVAATAAPAAKGNSSPSATSGGQAGGSNVSVNGARTGNASAPSPANANSAPASGAAASR